MIPQSIVDDLNSIREGYIKVLGDLKKVRSFQSLLGGNEKLHAEEAELRRQAKSPRIQEKFSPTFACAIVGSTGHGKTSILAELFPSLEERHWLQSDKTDTTSQALVIKYAPPGNPLLDEVSVDTWNMDQLGRLVQAADGECSTANIGVTSEKDAIIIDGSEAKFDTQDMSKFKFDHVQRLQPLPHPYQLSQEERKNPSLIRHLTVKEDTDKVPTGPVLNIDGQAFEVLQLRAAIKAVALHDSFQNISRNRSPAFFAQLFAL